MATTRDHCLAEAQGHVRFSQKYAVSQNYAKGSTTVLRIENISCRPGTEHGDLLLRSMLRYMYES